MSRWARVCIMALMTSVACAISVSAYPGSGRTSPGLRVYVDGRPGDVSFTTQLPPDLASRLRLGHIVSREAGTAIAVLPFNSSPTSYAMVTLRETGPRSYVNEVESLPVAPGLERTMVLDIPAYGVSLMTFVSEEPPGQVLRDYCSRLRAHRWAEVRSPLPGESTGVARLTKAGSSLEIRVSPKARGSIGTIWLNYNQSR